MRALMTQFYIQIRPVHLYMLPHFIQIKIFLVFRPASVHPQGVLIHFMSRLKKIVSRCKYQSTEQRIILLHYEQI